MIASSSNWSYVIVGYSVTAGVLFGYGVWLKQRARRLRRSIADDARD